MRRLSPNVAAEVQGDRVRPIVLMEGLFKSGWLRLWTGIGPLIWNGNEYTGSADLIGVSGITEASDIRADGAQFSLSGIPVDMVNRVINDVVQGAPARIYLAFVDQYDQLIGDPYQAFAGRIDVPSISEGAAVATATLTVENRLIDLRRSRERRFTDQDQHIDYPDDRGFEYVPALQEWNGTWGKAGPQGPGGAAAPGTPHVRANGFGNPIGGGLGNRLR